MSEPTKTCNLTEDEISCLIGYYGSKLSICSSVVNSPSESIERINYLNKRLKAFNEPAADLKSEPEAASGWASN